MAIKKILSNRELESLTTEEKIRYFEELKDYVKRRGHKKSMKNPFQDALTRIDPIIRNYDYDLRGLSNIPYFGPVLFVSNHSNSHDVFTFQDVAKMLGRRITSLGAKDDINFATALLFRACDGVLIDRNDKDSALKGMFKLASLIVNGQWGFVLGEATWNLHPYKPMHDIKLGAARIGAITEVPIVPVNIEYIEVPEMVSSERELYTRCIVNFGKPIYISREKSLIEQTKLIQTTLEQQRLAIWKDFHMERTSLEDVNPEIYCNHTWLKKFGAFGFTYDSLSEAKYLYSKDGKPVENEFRLEEDGSFVPGIIEKEEKKRFVMEKKR